MNAIIPLWKAALGRLLHVYESRRGNLSAFYPKLFLFFVCLNLLCYWWAMVTAFPEYLHGRQAVHYFKIQFPVGFLGAIFDSLSFFVTVTIVRRALRSRSSLEYIAHLSLDLAIAVLATFWVLFVFIFSGWLIHLLTPGAPVHGEEAFDTRQDRYGGLLIDALLHPFGNLRNIYFGFIMGVSASLPTCLHLYMFFRSGLRALIAR